MILEAIKCHTMMETWNNTEDSGIEIAKFNPYSWFASNLLQLCAKSRD